MPINSSFGALSYRVFAFGVGEYWILTSDESVRPFVDVQFDNQNDLYVLGHQGTADQENFIHLHKFNEINNFPFNVGSQRYRIVAATSDIPRPVLNTFARRLRYDSINNRFTVLSNARIGYPFTTPNNYVNISFSFQILTNLLRDSTSGRVDWGDDPQTTDWRMDDIGVDNDNLHYYFSGPTPTFSNIYRKERFTSQGFVAIGSGASQDPTFEISGSRFSGGISEFVGDTGGRDAVFGKLPGLFRLELNSDLDPVLFSPNDNDVCLIKFTQVPDFPFGTTLPGRLPITWGKKLSLSNNRLFSKNLALDQPENSLNNYYLSLFSSTSTSGAPAASASQLVKYSDSGASGTLEWQREISGVRFEALSVDSNGDCYVAGVIVSNNDLFVAKYNNAGVLQWQNKLSGYNNIIPSSIIYKDDLYICGALNTKGFVLKLPSDGSIPGTGTYNLFDSNNVVQEITYSVASQTESAANLTETAFDPSIGTLGRATSGRTNSIFAGNTDYKIIYLD